MPDFIEIVPEVTTFKEVVVAASKAKEPARNLLSYKQDLRGYAFGDTKFWIPKDLRDKPELIDKKSIGACILFEMEDNQYRLEAVPMAVLDADEW